MPTLSMNSTQKCVIWSNHLVIGITYILAKSDHIKCGETLFCFIFWKPVIITCQNTKSVKNKWKTIGKQKKCCGYWGMTARSSRCCCSSKRKPHWRRMTVKHFSESIEERNKKGLRPVSWLNLVVFMVTVD